MREYQEDFKERVNTLSTNPRISIIMSVYNGEDYIRETLDSILSQTFRDWELVVINDCSTDSTPHILKEYAGRDERVKHHNNEVNLRLQKSLNKALGLAKGEYIARMDADDICLPDRLQKQYDFMEANRDVALSSCRFMTVKNGVYASGGCGGRCDNDAIRAMLLVTNPILHPGVIARTDVIRELGYDDTCTCTEDLELWIRMSMQGKKMAILPECLLIYRLHDKQITSTTLEKQHKEVMKIQNKHYGSLLDVMDEEMQSFYISGVYFKEKADAKSFQSYAKWLKGANAKTKAFPKETIDYALFEMLAEYKRQGISKKDVIASMLLFSPAFIVKEIMRRKKTAKLDIQKCTQAAESFGLIRTGGTDEFPIFSKK